MTSDLDKRLLKRQAKGTPDEFWTVAVRRSAMADESARDDHLQQHLALAALFAGRGFKAGEREPSRLRAYLEMLRRARSKRCLAAELKTVEARMVYTLHGGHEPVLRSKKAKTLQTDIARYMISDARAFVEISESHDAFLDATMRELTRTARALFVSTGADGLLRHELRILEGDELVLLEREYKKLTSLTPPQWLHVGSGKIRIAQPGARDVHCLDLAIDPGVYRVALHNLSLGEKVVVLASRSAANHAANFDPQVLSTDGAP